MPDETKSDVFADALQKVHPVKHVPGTVLSLPTKQKGSIADRRDGPRYRTRLRSGKIANLRNRFVTECLFYDRSQNGARLRLPANVPLPNPFYLYDDETNTVATVQIAWRKLCVLGVKFIDEQDSIGIREALATSMSKSFYAV